MNSRMPPYPDLEKLLIETSWSVLQDCGLYAIPPEKMTREQIDMVSERISFELKAKLIEFFSGAGSEWLKQQFEVVDESVEGMRRHFQDIRQARENQS